MDLKVLWARFCTRWFPVTVRDPTAVAQGLIGVLMDPTAPHGDREEAATDLSAYDVDGVEDALARIACDASIYEGLADACGESLAEIWHRTGRINDAILVRLSPVALETMLSILAGLSPDLAVDATKRLRAEI
ncbi:hypothetical protein [Caulobacter hibisci]|uniref:CdiI immunity protein domain-containing protein n=1 Tax=Caulobacter hibisci TaxID=2035993 RepID=A0ABS0SZD0_9CAUL|nr:hypothetical protein [Caulobacter hibisci]MBI1684801.1 hypothetical protein [Caulobacter hibisci]